MDNIVDTKRNAQGQTLDEFVKWYKENEKDKYEKPSVTVDTLLFTVGEVETDNYRKVEDQELKILLIKRKDHPHIGQWAIPGGFIQMDEAISVSAYRELKEETNIDNIYMEQLYTWGELEEERDDPRMRIVSVSYMALVDRTKMNVIAGDDAEEAKWFSVKKELTNKIVQEDGIIETFKLTLKNNHDIATAIIEVSHYVVDRMVQTEIKLIEKYNIAFDHAKMIFYALDRLKNKVEYTDIIFNLMPETFTIKKLQSVYEVILGHSVYNQLFRKQIERKLIKTNQVVTGKGHRPATLYKFNPLWKLQQEGDINE